jgi:uncharacterized protein YndB with AHSA1/START domain
MSTTSNHGYLVIADISGYTSFVAKSELEHSHEILSELLELIMGKFQPLMTISKLEGDAVFAYAPETLFTQGDTLMEFLESTYVAFRDRQVSIIRKTTCTCNACRNISSLDLKFFAHHGDYILQKVANINELVGSDVNLSHRLTKNHVSETTGWQAYIMLTAQCLEHLKLDLTEAHVQVEAYEHLGEVKTYNIELHKRYKEITSVRRIALDRNSASFVITQDFSTPPAVTWEWVQDPAKRNLWNGGHVTWSNAARPRGRRGVGASNHCAHGKTVTTELIVDWRPFEYSTADTLKNGKKTFTETFLLEPLPDGGTRVVDMLKAHMPLPRFLITSMIRFVLLKLHKFDKALELAAKMAAEEFAKSKED